MATLLPVGVSAAAATNPPIYPPPAHNPPSLPISRARRRWQYQQHLHILVLA
ncbi:MAG: hypothetical protein H6668_01375 [Ardenticatenaceae bacterium]|nr:hypothetical protein [Ardenticatenaceae bacterium]